MKEFLSQPWPWYIAGPVIGLMIPALLILGNKPFGISSSLKHICAACFPGNIAFFKYDWKKESWNIVLAAGILAGGVVGGILFANPNPVAISPSTVQDLAALNVMHDAGLHPMSIFNFASLLTLKGFILIVVGGFLVGFGTRYANGCTSGHTIMGISNLQLSSVIASICFFIGGLVMTWFLLPHILNF
ncbi:MAG: YeeE/YedE family protein [Bacteroidota bacterium]|nr:YeeE/YedE family protein [Bacteroidota bacterium]